MGRAVAGNCGKFGVLGSRVEHDYVGVAESSFELRVGESVGFVLGGLLVIEYPFPLFFLGADVLCGGWKVPSWNYEGISLLTDLGTGTVSGTIRFRCEAEVEEMPLMKAA